MAEPGSPPAPRTLEELFTDTVPAPLLLLVAGPPRASSAGVPRDPATDLDDLLAASWALLRRGHVPLAGETAALPLARHVGAHRVEDDAFGEIVRPYARLLVARCDGVVRVGGPCAQADELVEQVRTRGGRTWSSVDAVPLVRPLVPG